MHDIFSDLRPGANAGIALWNKHKAEFIELLREINNSVFDDQYNIVGDLPKDISFTTYRLPEVARIRKPCITIESFGSGFICISPKNENLVQITYACCARIKWICEDPSHTNSIVEILRNAVKFLT
jgi:hypothetical protein